MTIDVGPLSKCMLSRAGLGVSFSFDAMTLDCAGLRERIRYPDRYPSDMDGGGGPPAWLLHKLTAPVAVALAIPTTVAAVLLHSTTPLGAGCTVVTHAAWDLAAAGRLYGVEVGLDAVRRELARAALRLIPDSRRTQ